jgi:2,4-dienoyl-CoA reductase-like NADH-dependent reductase (Old Yellow Enzyme family)
MSALFSPIEIGGVTLPNRIIVSPMCQYSAIEGSANSWHETHLGGLALSGAGLLFTEATSVSADGRITPGDLGIYSNENIDALARVMRVVHNASDIVFGMQLAHAGRKGSSREPWNGGQLIPLEEGGWVPFAPSAVPHAEGERAPAAMTPGDLEQVKREFVEAARRSVEIGFEVLELHCAHGYLLHQFLSPVANHRDDQYGGSLENRMRYPLEIFDAVRATVPGRVPVGIRVSATDWLEHLDIASWRLQDTLEFAAVAERRGCAFMDISSAGISPLQKISVGPGYQVPFAAAVKERVKIPVISVGMITEPAQAEAIIAEGKADCVALARAMLYDPRWPWHAASALGGTVQAAKQYWRSIPSGAGRIFGDVKVGQR